MIFQRHRSDVGPLLRAFSYFLGPRKSLNSFTWHWKPTVPSPLLCPSHNLLFPTNTPLLLLLMEILPVSLLPWSRHENLITPPMSFKVVLISLLWKEITEVIKIAVVCLEQNTEVVWENKKGKGEFQTSKIQYPLLGLTPQFTSWWRMVMKSHLHRPGNTNKRLGRTE